MLQHITFTIQSCQPTLSDLYGHMQRILDYLPHFELTVRMNFPSLAVFRITPQCPLVDFVFLFLSWNNFLPITKVLP